MKRNALILVCVVAMIAFVAPLESVAQARWGLDLRGSVDFPTKSLGGADLNTGFGIEPTVTYRFMPHLGVYAGWGWHQFNTDEMVVGNDMDVEETGYTFGLQFTHPIEGTSLSYFIRAGGIHNHIEVENDEGDITADSGHGFGWQAEAGIVVSMNDHWSLMPGVRYRALSRDLEIENVTTNVDLNYVSVGVSFARSLGK